MFQGRKSIAAKLLILLFFGFFLYAIGVYAPLIRNTVIEKIGHTTGFVKGANITSSDIPSISLPEKIQNDLSSQAGVLRQQGLQVSVGDLISSAGRVRKVFDDIMHIRDITTGKLQEFAGEK